MTHSKACDSVPAGEPAYTRNGYRFYAQPDGTWLIVDGEGEDARRAATFALATSGRPSNIQLLGLYSTQRFQLEDLIEKFAKHAASAGGERGG